MISQVADHDDEKVRICDGSWTEKENLTMVAKMHEWKVKHLYIRHNQIPGIVKQINHIRFLHLTELILTHNHIDCVEALPGVYMPFIQELCLLHNYIGSVAILRKAEWPSLSLLNISGNVVRDAKTLTQGNMGNLRKLWVYHWYGEQNKFVESSFPFKLQARSLKYLGLLPHRLGIRRTKQVFYSKWKRLRVN